MSSGGIYMDTSGEVITPSAPLLESEVNLPPPENITAGIRPIVQRRSRVYSARFDDMEMESDDRIQLRMERKEQNVTGQRIISENRRRLIDEARRRVSEQIKLAQHPVNLNGEGSAGKSMFTSVVTPSTTAVGSREEVKFEFTIPLTKSTTAPPSLTQPVEIPKLIFDFDSPAPVIREAQVESELAPSTKKRPEFGGLSTITEEKSSDGGNGRQSIVESGAKMEDETRKKIDAPFTFNFEKSSSTIATVSPLISFEEDKKKGASLPSTGFSFAKPQTMTESVPFAQSTTRPEEIPKAAVTFGSTITLANIATPTATAATTVSTTAADTVPSTTASANVPSPSLFPFPSATTEAKTLPFGGFSFGFTGNGGSDVKGVIPSASGPEPTASIPPVAQEVKPAPFSFGSFAGTSAPIVTPPSQGENKLSFGSFGRVPATTATAAAAPASGPAPTPFSFPSPSTTTAVPSGSHKVSGTLTAAATGAPEPFGFGSTSNATKPASGVTIRSHSPLDQPPRRRLWNRIK